jgi:hypothetical protein
MSHPRVIQKSIKNSIWEGVCNLGPVELKLTSGLQLFKVEDVHLHKINSLKPPPPEAVTADRIFARAMKLTGDAENSYHGRFHTKDLPVLIQMTESAPVLECHNKYSSLPIGRFFDGKVQKISDVSFTVNAFYFGKTGRGSEIAENIDIGVYNECSISFVCGKMQCSECEHDIRTWLCRHYPGVNGVFYWYENLKEVLEGSIVYRGAHPDTGFVRDFADLERLSLENRQFGDLFAKRDSVVSGKFPKPGRVFVVDGIKKVLEV